MKAHFVGEVVRDSTYSGFAVTLPSMDVLVEPEKLYKQIKWKASGDILFQKYNVAIV